MANADYSQNPDLAYKAKGKRGIKPSVLFPKKPSAGVNMKYPGIPKKGMKFIKPGCPESY